MIWRIDPNINSLDLKDFSANWLSLDPEYCGHLSVLPHRLRCAVGSAAVCKTCCLYDWHA